MVNVKSLIILNQSFEVYICLVFWKICCWIEIIVYKLYVYIYVYVYYYILIFRSICCIL